MAALVWLLIPLAAAVVAAVWGRWAARRRTTGDGASLAGYERFREAMQSAAVPAGKDGRTQGRKQGRKDGAKDVEGDPPVEGGEDSPRGPVAGPVP